MPTANVHTATDGRRCHGVFGQASVHSPYHISGSHHNCTFCQTTLTGPHLYIETKFSDGCGKSTFCPMLNQWHTPGFIQDRLRAKACLSLPITLAQAPSYEGQVESGCKYFLLTKLSIRVIAVLLTVLFPGAQIFFKSHFVSRLIQNSRLKAKESKKQIIL